MLNKYIKEYISVNKMEILVVVGMLLLGVVIGVGAYVFSTTEIKQLLVTNVKSVLDISKNNAYIKTNVITNGIKINLITVILFVMLSATLFGKYGIYCLTILKGAAISLYTIVIFKVFGALWGIVAAFFLVILVNVLYIPAFIYLAITFLEVNFNIFKTKLNINGYNTYKVLLIVFATSVLMFCSVIVEQIASNVVLNIYNKM